MRNFIIAMVTSVLSLISGYAGINRPGPSIVFIHIGNSLPNYLEIAIRQARLFNDCDIILLANRTALDSAKDLLATKYEAVCIECESLQQSIQHERFIKKSKIDRDFRNGFWSHATERFFYLQDLINQYNLSHVVHLESDIMLYVDIKTLMPLFTKHYTGIGATFDNDKRCIPGFVYVASRKSMNHLARHILKQAMNGKNDMESLGKYKQLFGTSHINQLPVIMNTYVIAHELVSPMGHQVKDKFNYCKYFEQFYSIFDAAALGQYLGGIDPRNDNLGPGFINESCIFNPSLLEYEWIVDDKGRKVPYVSYRNVRRCRINNLHIHCKNLAPFLSN